VGSGTLTFSVAINPNSGPRSGTLSIGGQSFVVNQAGTAVAAAPRLKLEQVAPPAGAVVTIQGRGNKMHVLEVSTDLIHWTPISTNLITDAVCPTCPFVQVIDSQALLSPIRFYRAREE